MRLPENLILNEEERGDKVMGSKDPTRKIRRYHAEEHVNSNTGNDT